MTEKTKHLFVDDNPYLVYTGEPDTAIEGGSGGALIIDADTNINSWTSSAQTVSVNASQSDIMGAFTSGKPLIMRAFTNSAHTGFVYLYFDRFTPGSDVPINEFNFVRYDLSSSSKEKFKANLQIGLDASVICRVQTETIS